MDREIPLSVKKKEKRKLIIKFSVIGLVLVALITGLTLFLETSLNTSSLMVAETDRGSIEITVNASGKIIPLMEEIITSPISTRIVEVYKSPGDSVTKGEPILKLELASIETDYQQKLDEREMKRSKLAQQQTNWDNTLSELDMQLKVKEMQLKQMYTELQNERYLDSIGASTLDKIRQIELNYEVSRLEIDQLRQKIDNQRKNAQAEKRVQELELSIFEKSLGESSRLLQNAQILSPQNATLTFINNQIGSQVGQGSQIAVISDLSRFKVEAEVADSYIEKLSLGAKAIIEIGQLKLTGRVSNITPSVSNGVIKFVVLLDDAANPALRSGLNADVYVIHGIQQDVLRLPNGPYFNYGRGDYDLWVVKGGRAEKRTVKLGESSFEYVEVISGLEQGEKVILSDMSKYKNKESLKIK